MQSKAPFSDQLIYMTLENISFETHLLLFYGAYQPLTIMLAQTTD